MKKDIKNIDRFKKEKVFQTPENYFEDFALKMSKEISEKDKIESNWMRFVRLLQLRISLPLAILFVIGGIILNRQNVPDNYGDVIITDDQIQAYLMEETKRNDLVMDWAVEGDFIEEIEPTDEDIIEYLLEEEIEIQTLNQYYNI